MLSIIVTHYRCPVLLKLCLKSIQENIDDIDYEIVVVDSQAKLKTQKLIKEIFPNAKIISFSKNIINYSKLINAGIKAVRGDYILVLNHDIIIKEKAISQMLEFIKNNSKIGIVGPQLLTFSNIHQDSCFKFPTIGMVLARRTFLKKLKWGKNFLVKNKDFFSARSVDWVQGSAMLVRKIAIDKVGLWDERFNRYFEDTDWCRRFWQKGYKVVYLPTACMFHYYGRHSKKWGSLLDPLLNKYTRIHLISAFKYFWKWRKQYD